jgi:cell division protein FtsQ
MWDRPDILNRISSALIGIAGVLIAYLIVSVVARLSLFDLREIHVLDTPGHVTRVQVETIVRKEMKGTFFTLNLAAVRRAFEKLPWVREVNLRRQWPGRLEVTVNEHVALARWGTAALVNTQGEIFQAAYDGPLPTFIGPQGTSKEIAIQYEFFRRNLAAIGATPALVQLTPRRAWQVRLDGGPMVALGRDDVEARLARFIGVYSRTLGTLKRRIDYVDLRYANGFAVRIPEFKDQQGDGSRGASRTKRGAKGSKT